MRSLASRLRSPNSKFVSSGEVPFGILESRGTMSVLKKLTRKQLLAIQGKILAIATEVHARPNLSVAASFLKNKLV